ncbi:MAG: hypothetical protein RL186_1890 [Pseudomonadota bacterium]
MPTRDTAKPRPAQNTDTRAQSPKPAKKLSFKDARRLSEAEALIPKLEAQIAACETLLNDPELYQRNPTLFANTSHQLTNLRTQLTQTETDWLDLTALAESLEVKGV